MNKKLLLIDGHSILNRAFYGLPDLTNSGGEHTNAVLGFLNIMLKLIEEESASNIMVAFDVKNPTFRHLMFKEYKGTRKPMPTELVEQVPLIKEVLTAMGVTIIERPGYEADDILGTISKEAAQEGFKVSVISGDRDLLQLATDDVLIRIPKTKMSGTTIENYYAKDVLEKYEVTPLEFIDLKGLMGDTADNIPGVPGIGEKTATKIIKEYKSIENAHEHLDEIKPRKAQENLGEYYEQALLSKTLATIKTDCELEYNLDNTVINDLFNKDAYIIMKRLEFKNLLSRFETQVDVPAFSLECCLVEDLGQVETHFKKAAASELAGVSLLKEDDVYGVSLAYEQGKSYYLPVQGFVTKEYLISQVNALYQSQTCVVTLNLKESLFDLLIDEQTPGVFDAGIAAYLLNPLKDTYHYDDIARDYLDLMLNSKEELIRKGSIKEALVSNEDQALKVVCYFAYIPFIAQPVLSKQLKDLDMIDLFTNIEMPTIFSLYDMQARGIKVNRQALKEYGESLIGQISDLEQSIYNEAGQVFNINSPKQLGNILFEELKLPGGKKTKTGYSTSVDVLEKLQPDYPIIAQILEYRHLTKLKSTYADGLANYILDDERIHGKFNQTITATGRISSTDPNLQNIPIRMPLGRAIRKVFIPEDGYIFVDADYSQIELRVLAHISGDETLINAYKNNQDIHAITASEVFHVPLEQVSDDQRRNAKAVNFGIVYGLSAFGLSQDLNITRKQASEYIERYFDTYKQVKKFLDDAVTGAKENGMVRTIFNRIRPIPELQSSNFMQRNFGERVAMNSPIQGSAADIMKIATIHVNMKMKKLAMKSRLILQIHDELLIEASLDEVDQVKAILEEEMMHAASLAVPLEIGVSTGNNWFEAK